MLLIIQKRPLKSGLFLFGDIMSEKREIKNTAINYGYIAKAYRNLNRRGVVWSILNKSTGLVDQYANNVFLSNVEFKVSKAGQTRVRKEKRKNVHAFITGNILNTKPRNIKWLKATYNPYKDEGFHLIENNTILTKVKYAMLCKSGLYVSL